jgi:hypothetical protein
MTPKQVEYVGKDLEAMSFADSYHRWILDLMRPYIGRNVVEVGAGTGSFSELILTSHPDSLTMVEPSDMFTELRVNMSPQTNGPQLRFHHDVFPGGGRDSLGRSTSTSIVYVNVLEHTEMISMSFASAPNPEVLLTSICSYRHCRCSSASSIAASVTFVDTERVS